MLRTIDSGRRIWYYASSWDEAVIEIYDITNGKLKYSAYTFWQLCEMATEDFAYHTADEANDIIWWIEDKAKDLCKAEEREKVVRRLGQLLEFGEKEGHRAFASRLSLLLGEIALEDGRPEATIEWFQRAVSLLPDSVEALHRLARGFSAVGEYQKAAATLRKANGIQPSEEAYLALAEIQGKLNGRDHYEKGLRSLLTNYPSSIRGMHALAQLYLRRGKNRAAARLFQRIVDLHPDKPDDFGPSFAEFVEALIWSKCNYEARRVEKVLDFLDEEQQRNPDERLGLLKAVMLYRLDKRICREECSRELAGYFEGIGCEKAIVEQDLSDLTGVFGREFSRGVVRFVKNQFARHLLRRELHTPPAPHVHASSPAQDLEPGESDDQSPAKGREVRSHE